MRPGRGFLGPYAVMYKHISASRTVAKVPVKNASASTDTYRSGLSRSINASLSTAPGPAPEARKVSVLARAPRCCSSVEERLFGSAQRRVTLAFVNEWYTHLNAPPLKVHSADSICVTIRYVARRVGRGLHRRLQPTFQANLWLSNRGIYFKFQKARLMTISKGFPGFQLNGVSLQRIFRVTYNNK